MPRSSSAKSLDKAKQRFRTALTEYIVRKGAQPSDFYDYELPTPAGTLRFSVHDTWIATRFDDPALARRFCDCNQYSGKWNFHFCDGTAASLDPATVIAHFGYQLDRLLSWEPNSAGTAGVQ